MSLKYQCQDTGEGYFTLNAGVAVPTRIFFSEKLYAASEEGLYSQIKNATEYPGVVDVAVTPDAHIGSTVPVGSVIATEGTLLHSPVGYDIGCFTGDTLVPTVDGHSYTLRDLAERSEEDLFVYALNLNHRVTVARAFARKTRSAAPLLRVVLDNEREIICTPDHEFMLRDGTYCQAQDLHEGTSLMPFYSERDKDGYVLVQHPANKLNHKVTSVERLQRTEDVYCLTVPDYGNFALDAGVFVHNCGILCFRSDVPVSKGRDERLKRKWSEEVMKRVGIGVGQQGHVSVTRRNLQEILRHGANALHYRHEQTERNFLPLDDTWTAPTKAVEKGLQQLCSLGGGNHFIELQHDQDGYLWGMIHTGSRGFGYQLAAHYIALAREEMKVRGNKSNLDATYFPQDSPHWNGYKNAVAAGGNFATANRLMIWEQVAIAFRRVFGTDPELYYEISHNLAQEEILPDGRTAWVHRKGATRAFPAGHAALIGTKWEKTGHPVLIPGSMGDSSYVLFPRAGVEKSLYSVNHGCGRQFSRSEARQRFSQSGVNKQMKTLGVMVNGGGVDVPIDESPGVYKSSQDVIAAVVAANLAEVHTTLTPLATIKGAE